MDRRRAAGALLALAACIACSAAAPTASNHTALDLYEGAPEGCYYNFQHYGEGDRIMTNEPCLNCTCHNRMLMCYLRVCPFTKPIGQDCTVEKRADQCCPIVTCPDVPVDLLTSTSTSSPAEYGATGLGKLDKYGCSIKGKYFPEGSKVPPTPNKPCEHCYCIRNMTTCVMQECTLHVDGCTPIYHKDVCCPVRYSCDHPEDEMPLLDDMSTTVRPTPGFLLTTTTLSPVTQMTQDCVHNDQVIADGASITTDKACEHCYCMKGDIVCVVQECGAPMENEGKNCTSLPPREGQCCPDTYICEGDELTTEISTESATDTILEKLTTLSPPRRAGIEGSGYRNEPSEGVYTEMPTAESELEGSGEEEEPIKTTDTYEPSLPGQSLEPEIMTPSLEDGDQYIPVTTKAPTFEEPETTTKEFDRNSISDDNVEKEIMGSQSYKPTTNAPVEEVEDKITTSDTEGDNVKPHEHVTIAGTSTPESYEKITTESSESLNTVSDLLPAQEHEKPHENTVITTDTPAVEESGSTISEGSEGTKGTPSDSEPQVTQSVIAEGIPASKYTTPSAVVPEDVEEETTEKSDTEHTAEKESFETESYDDSATSAPQVEQGGTVAPKESGEVTFADILKDKESSKPAEYIPSTTSVPVEAIEKLTTEPDHAQNTVAVAEEGFVYPHVPSSEETEKTPSTDLEDAITEKVTKGDSLEHHERTTTQASVSAESEMLTAEPDKGLNTIPSEIDEESSSQPSLVDRTTLSVETEPTEQNVIMHATEPQDVDIKSSTSASSTPSEIHVTKGDQYTITTEPSFRKEDDIRVTTEKQKEESVATTIKAEFVDEGLIPTSTHDEKLSTGSDMTNIDEEMTTVLPEYSQGLEETSDFKRPTTESIMGTPVVSDTIPEKIAVTVSEQEGGLPSSTEKSADVTEFTPDMQTHEEPSRIPGEGDCLLNGVTYRNNTVVPSTNNCHTGCKCVSSIIKCDPIICSPPPDYMDNCQSIYDTPDSCCPTYVCDHPKETIPPQSDNQMTGTEPPVPPPVIECRGDQCELSESTKQPIEPSEPCTSDSCLNTADHKPEISECGPKGCDSVVKEPEPTVEEPGCTDGQCQLPPTDSQVSPSKPCEGDDCKAPTEQVTSPEHCENEEDCKKQEIPDIQTVPCAGDSCPNADCGSSGCIPGAVLPPQDHQQVPCKEEDDCKPQEITPSECTGDTPCRRKDTPAEVLPSKCEDSDCVPKTDISDTQHLSTQTSIPEVTPLGGVTEKITPIQENKVSEPPAGQLPGDEKQDTTPITQFVTETEHIHTPTEHGVYETTEPEIKIDEVTQKAPEVVDISTDEPSLAEDVGISTEKPTATEDVEKPSIVQEEVTRKPETNDEEETDEEKGTEIPNVIDEHTSKPTLVEEEGTKAPNVEVEEQNIKPTLTQEEVPEVNEEEPTSKPALVEEDDTKVTDKPAMVEEEGTKITDVIEEEHAGKPGSAEDESTKISDIEEGYTDEPALLEETGTKTPDHVYSPDIDVELQTAKPGLDEEVGTKIPDDVVEEQTSKPAIVEEAGTKIPDDNEEEQTGKPVIVEGEDIKVSEIGVPAIIKEEHPEKLAPTDEDDIKTDVIAEGYTDEPTLVEDTATKIPDIVVQEQTSKPTLTEEEATKIPEIITEEHTDRSMLHEEEGTKIVDGAEGYTDEPAIIEETGTKLPHVFIEEQTDKPALVEEETTKVPDVAGEEQTDSPAVGEEYSTKVYDIIGEEHTGKPALSEEEGTKVPDVFAEGQTVKPAIVEETGTKIPGVIVEEQTVKSVPEEEEVTKMTNVVEGFTNEPTTVEEMSTRLPDTITEEQTNKPDVDAQEGTRIPDIEEQTGKPGPLEEEGSKIPDASVEDQTNKPALVEEEGTKIPNILEEHTDKSVTAAEDDTKITEVTVSEHIPALQEEQGSTELDTSVKEHTDKPGLVADTSTDAEDAEKPDSGEIHTEKPISVEGEITKMPDVVTTQDKVKEKPILEEQELAEKPEEKPEEKPGLLEEDSITDHPISDGESTEIPDSADVSDTKKPMLIDESTFAPAEIEFGKETTPTAVEEASTDKPVVTDKNTDISSMVEEGTKEPTVLETSPDLVDKEHTDEPKGPEEYTEAPTPSDGLEHSPQLPEDTIRTEPKKEVKLPESLLEQHTEMTDTATKMPFDELQTTKIEDESHTESYLKPIDLQKPEEIIPPEVYDSSTLVPDVQTHEIATQTLAEQEKVTMAPLSQTISEEKLTPMQEGEQETSLPAEHVTLPQEPLTNAHEATKTPEYVPTTESVDKVTKSTERETSEQSEIYTDMPEQDSSVTKSPVNVIIDKQDGEPSVSPDVTVKIPVDEESTTTVFEKDIIKPVAPDSHITDAIPVYDGTSAVPESEIVKVTEIPEALDAETQKEELLKPQDIESEEMPTKSSQDVGEQEIKTGQPEVFTPEREEMMTSTIASAVTEPVKGYTEIEDAFVTGQSEITTGYYREPSDHLEPSTTEKSDILSSSTETSLSGTKATVVSEESYTEPTDAPVLGETQPTDVHIFHKPDTSTVLPVVEEPAATESTVLSETPEHETPVTGVEDTSKITATGLSEPVETAPQGKPMVPVEDIGSPEDKTTISPEPELSTVPEIYIPGEQAATDIPEPHISTSVQSEQSKPTESSYAEEHITEAQESGVKSEEPKPADSDRTTRIPELFETPTGTQAPELSHTEAHESGIKEQPDEAQKSSSEYPATFDESHTELPHAQASTEPSLSLITEQKPGTTVVEDTATEKQDTDLPAHETHTEPQEQITEKLDVSLLPEVSTSKQVEEVTKSADQTSAQVEYSETTPYLIELEEHTHKMVEDISTTTRIEEEDHTYKAVEDIVTPSPIDEDHTHKIAQDLTTTSLSEDEHAVKTQEYHSTTLPSIEFTHKTAEDTSTVAHSIDEITTVQGEVHSPEAVTEKISEEEVETSTKQVSGPSELTTTVAPVGYQTTLTLEEASEKLSEGSGATEPTLIDETTAVPATVQADYDIGQKEVTTTKSIQELEGTSPTVIDTEKSPVSDSDIKVPTDKETVATPKPLHPDIRVPSQTTTVPEDELILSTTKATTIKQEEILTPVLEDKYGKPEEKPTSEISPPSPTAEIPKPPAEMQPTDEVSPPEDDGHFPPSGTGYGEPDYVEEDQAFGPGTCRYGGKVYVSAQQIPRDDPCDFCFCFRSDIICLQQSCPPPIHGCHEEPIQGFCCPRYECPVSMATTVNVTTTTTTTTTTLPPHFPTHPYKGAAQRRGCQIKGHTYKVGEVVRSSSGPCLHCTCGGDGQMKCDPKACTPEPMLRQMIAAAVSAKRRR